MKRYIMTFDQGTTSSRTVIYDLNGEVVSVSKKEIRQIYPQAGYVEHDAEEIFETQLFTAREAISKAGINADEIAALGITNQRETSVLWDKSTGKPVRNAIVWQCRRTAALCEELKSKGYEATVAEKTGLKLDAYFSGTKLNWIFDNDPSLLERAKNGELLFGTIDSFLLWKFTGIHATDITNAGRTLLFNIHTLDWDDDLLKMLGIPRQVLPEIRPSIGFFGKVRKDFFGSEIPVSGIAGDQHASLFGNCCFEQGDVKNTYGTGCFALMNTGKTPAASSNGLLTTIGWADGKNVYYALEGSVYSGGCVIQWLRDELGIIKSASETNEAVYNVPDNGGIYFVPAFTGLGAPYWDMFARGTISGITRGTNKYHLIRAALESIALQSADLIEAMQKDYGKPIRSIKVDGGATENNFLMQLQADLLKIAVDRPKNIETTALGAAMMAGVGAGIWSFDEVKRIRKSEKIFTPEKDETKLIDGWHNAVRDAMNDFRH